jgi:hypothetical protein
MLRTYENASLKGKIYDTKDSLKEIIDDIPIGARIVNISKSMVKRIIHFPESVEWLICCSAPLEHIPPLPEGLLGLCIYNTNLKTLGSLPNSLEFLSCEVSPVTDLGKLPENLLYFNHDLKSNKKTLYLNLLPSFLTNDCLNYKGYNMDDAVFKSLPKSFKDLAAIAARSSLPEMKLMEKEFTLFF